MTGSAACPCGKGCPMLRNPEEVYRCFDCGRHLFACQPHQVGYGVRVSHLGACLA